MATQTGTRPATSAAVRRPSLLTLARLATAFPLQVRSR